MDLKELESGVDPKTHWYYQSKKIPLFRFFKQLAKKQAKRLTVIDFGSGSGFFAYELLEAFPESIDEVLLIDIGYSDEEIEASNTEKVKKLRFIPKGISDCVVIMMDVLEHIEDDYKILKEIREAIAKNGHYFITVPAFMSVWSSHDVYLGHYRRYTIPMLGNLLKKCNCVIENQYYIYGSIFPLVWAVRRMKRNEKNMSNPSASDMKPVPKILNFALKQYNSFEMNFRKFNKLFGLTCVAEGKLK